MNLYKCIVYDENKKKKTIKVNVESKSDIAQYSINNKINIVKIKKVVQNNKGKVKDKELKIMCKEMSILLESGCEITKLLNILKSESNKKISNLISQIHNLIQNGNSITESFLSTNLFSNFFISMIKAGEVSGNLDIVMDNLSNYYEKEHKLKSKMGTILIYPAMLAVVSIVVTIFIIIAVIPNFQMIFENNGINPPALTRILINISIILKNNFITILIGLVTFIAIVAYLIKNSYKAKYKISTIKFKLPFIQNMTKLIIATRFSRTLYILINSGVQIVEAIEIASNVIDNEFAYDRLMIGNEYIKKGNSIGDSLSLANIFPSLFISMIKIGEESGKLDTSLNTINKFYESELDTKMQQFISAIEPIIIVFIGIIVGSLIISMVIPMFDIVNAI